MSNEIEMLAKVYGFKFRRLHRISKTIGIEKLKGKLIEFKGWEVHSHRSPPCKVALHDSGEIWWVRPSFIIPN